MVQIFGKSENHWQHHCTCAISNLKLFMHLHKKWQFMNTTSNFFAFDIKIGLAPKTSNYLRWMGAVPPDPWLFLYDSHT